MQLLPRSLRSRCDRGFFVLDCWPLASSALDEFISATGGESTAGRATVAGDVVIADAAAAGTAAVTGAGVIAAAAAAGVSVVVVVGGVVWLRRALGT